MDKRGQSALEYLMTYGWALIVIAIVVGVLVYIMGSSTSGVRCTSDTTEIMVIDQDANNAVVGNTGVIMVLQNATGTTIIPTMWVGNGDFDNAVPSTTTITDPGTWVSGTQTTIAVTVEPGTLTLAAGLQNNFSGGFGFSYLSAGGLTKDANITCSGSLS